jgi:Domain of unknown function (DUF4260)
MSAIVAQRTAGTAVTLILRLEAGLALAAALLGYSALSGSWLLFALLFLVPDLTMLGYLRNPGTGVVVYNAGHTYISPAALALAGFIAGAPLAEQFALIWAAHIALDRVLGFGLKYPGRFADTHLSKRGLTRGFRLPTATTAAGR